MRRLRALLGLALAALGACWGYKAGWLWFVRPDAAHAVRGIDVSHHQGEIDWAAVAAEGWRFAWIKATEGRDWTDPRFQANRDGAEAAGLDWGAYHFFTFCSPPEAQAAHLLAALGERPGVLPPVVDVERGGNCQGARAFEDLSAALGTFLAIVEGSLGRELLIYLLPGQWPDLFGAAGPPDRPLWVRGVRARPRLPDGRAWTVWQYHNRGLVAGISGWVDLNAFHGTEADYRALTCTGVRNTQYSYRVTSTHSSEPPCPAPPASTTPAPGTTP